MGVPSFPLPLCSSLLLFLMNLPAIIASSSTSPPLCFFLSESEYHADCEELLLEDGSQQEDIWGADWYPESKTVEFIALINIRPRQDNRGMEIEDPKQGGSEESVLIFNYLPHPCAA